MESPISILGKKSLTLTSDVISAYHKESFRLTVGQETFTVLFTATQLEL
jgi:hypothetical protein